MDRPVDLIVRSRGPEDTASIAAAIAAVMQADDVIVLGGDLGAGKTTFTKALGAGLGIAEAITSPTFALVQTYQGGRLPLHHLDVYRLNGIEEAIDLALPELYESGGAVVIEWGETIAPALPRSYLLIEFVFADHDHDRQLHISAVGQGWQARGATLSESLGKLLADRQGA